jgi:exodeoxyribonuclease V beta subunit
MRPAYRPKSVLGGDGPVTSRRFRGRIDDSWGISSFSSIAAGRHVEASPAEGDKVTQKVESGPVDGGWNGLGDYAGDDQRDIFDFPTGAGAGSFMHAVFEDLDFRADPTEIPPVVAAKLAAFGFDATWTTTICDMVKNVLSVSLPGREETFTLSEIGPGDRLNELEFYFPIKALSGRDLATAVFQETGVGGQGQEQRYIGETKRSPSRGFMRGFVDLVFRHNGWYYIVDWKSNLLGPQVVDYDQDRLQAVMMNERYTVQYLIYTVALNQYLARRVADYDYDRYFGGVFYLFVRGMDPGRGNRFGVYSTRPDGRLIHWLSDRLMGRVPDRTP